MREGVLCNSVRSPATSLPSWRAMPPAAVGFPFGEERCSVGGGQSIGGCESCCMKLLSVQIRAGTPAAAPAPCRAFPGGCGGVSLLVRIYQGGVSFSRDSAASPCCCHRLSCSPRSCALGRGKDTFPVGMGWAAWSGGPALPLTQPRVSLAAVVMRLGRFGTRFDR